MPWKKALAGTDENGANRDEEPRVLEMDDEQMRANDRDFANFRENKLANFDGFSYRKATDGLGASYILDSIGNKYKSGRPSREGVS